MVCLCLKNKGSAVRFCLWPPMKKILWKYLTLALKSINPSIRAQIINFKYLAIDRAQFKSIKLGRPVDNKMNPIPWWTYPVIDYLNQFDFNDEIIFEYGPGNGTLWFLDKGCKKIISIENDKSWYKELEETKHNNQIVLFREKKEDYFSSILNYDSTVLIIDGKWRKENVEFICSNFEKINNNLKMIIIDNPDKFQLGEQIRDITNLHNFVQADFFGFGPAFRGIGCTTVLINSSNKIKRSTKMTSYLDKD